MVENVLNAVAAGLIIGCLYGLMCIGLGLIFGIMKVVNFAQGELLMLGMYVSLYLVGGFVALGIFGPYIGPFVAALLAGPVLFAGGALLHRFLISHVSGLSIASRTESGGFGQLIVTLGISLILQNGGLIVFGSTPKSVLTPLSARAFILGPVPGRCAAVPQPGARLFLRGRDRGRGPAVAPDGAHQARQIAARSGG